MRRGEVWWALVDKRRPVVLVSRNEAYDVRAMVIVAPATTTVRGFALEVKLGRREGLPRDCVVNCDWLVTIPKSDLIERAGSLSASKARTLDEELAFSLGLDWVAAGDRSWMPQARSHARPRLFPATMPPAIRCARRSGSGTLPCRVVATTSARACSSDRPARWIQRRCPVAGCPVATRRRNERREGPSSSSSPAA